MEEDKFALVEKILKDIDNVMAKNAELFEFDIVPADINLRNKSPVLHSENCLGLESWCVKHVYMYCYTELMDKFFAKFKRKTTVVSFLTSERLYKLLNVTLLLNPELTFLWNKRREMVLKKFCDKSLELVFTRIVLSRKPKCNDAFAYRRWLLEALFQDSSSQTNYVEDFVNEELHICELASEKSPNNYHSWNHRMWLVNTLKNTKRRYNMESLYIKEYCFSGKWTSKHISDFSCFHYRQFCIQNILGISNWKIFENTIDTNLHKTFVKVLLQNHPKDVVNLSEETLLSYSDNNLVDLILGCAPRSCKCGVNSIHLCRTLELLLYELILNNELLRFYKYHETLWYHRRFIVHKLIVIMYDYFGLTRNNGVLIKKICQICNSAANLRQKN